MIYECYNVSVPCSTICPDQPSPTIPPTGVPYWRDSTQVTFIQPQVRPYPMVNILTLTFPYQSDTNLSEEVGLIDLTYHLASAAY